MANVENLIEQHIKILERIKTLQKRRVPVPSLKELDFDIKKYRSAMNYLRKTDSEINSEIYALYRDADSIHEKILMKSTKAGVHLCDKGFKYCHPCLVMKIKKMEP